ncbi:MAG: twitching motility protein PilT [Eubacterium sp.]|nr:twitching motility protein PilT [Eubacterium sp.]
MVRFVVGNEGKGKTRYLLEQANTAIREASGNVVYLDKSSSKMYELNNRIRLIDLSKYPLRSSEEFIGFICGIISQDHDLEKVYVDNFIRLAKITDDEGLARTAEEIEMISSMYQVDFTLSISKDKEELAPALQEKVVAAL